MFTKMKTLVKQVAENVSVFEKSAPHYICPAVSFRWSFVVVFILAFVCYACSINGSFVFDDTEAIVNNKDVTTDTALSQVFFNDFWGTLLTHKSSHKSYRPLTILSFRLNRIVGGLDPIPFHLVNVILHCVCSSLSLVVFARIFRESRPRLSFISAVVFSVHPVHTEAVAGIVGRADLLCCIFYFISIYAYTIRSTRLYFAVSMASCAVAMLCKEQGITVLAILAVFDLAGGMDGSIVRRFSLMTLVGLALLYGRLRVMGWTRPAFQPVDNPASFAQSIVTRTLSYNYIYAMHGGLVLWPHWLCFDWSMGCIPLIHEIQDFRNFAAILLWSILISCLFKAVLSRSRCLILGLALLVTPFLPATNLFFPVGFVVAERVLFIPVAGYCILFVYGLEKLNVIYPACWQLWRSCLALVICLYILKSLRRSLDWQDERSLFLSALSVCPLNAKVHYNLGKNAADRGLRHSAIERYEKALQLNPDYDQAMNNLANLLKDTGRLESAEQWLMKAVRVRSDFAAAWMNLGIVQALLKKHEMARVSYLTALTHRNKYPDCFYNLGNLYLELERYEEADEAFRNATRLQPGHVLAWTNLIVMLDNIGKWEQSEKAALQALELLPNEANLHFSLAAILGKHNRFEESEKHFISAIAINANSAIYHTNLGVLYHRWKKFAKARICYLQALKINGQCKSAADNLKLLQQQLNA